jgi:hypothetical protein
MIRIMSPSPRKTPQRTMNMPNSAGRRENAAAPSRPATVRIVPTEFMSPIIIRSSAGYLIPGYVRDNNRGPGKIQKKYLQKLCNEPQAGVHDAKDAVVGCFHPEFVGNDTTELLFKHQLREPAGLFPK